MENACIIGYGMVGKAMGEVFGIHKHFDLVDERCNINLEEASKCRFVFICLPTPVDKDGNYLLEPIKQIIRQIEDFGSGCIYIVRSTVFPGFALSLQKEMGIDRIISNPEFLSEATAIEDVKNPPFIVIGGLEGKYRQQVRGFYEGRIKGASVIETDNTTAEFAKVALNAYFATKVIFANQAKDGAQLVDANYETVKKIMESHPYGPKNHFQVWFRGKRGVHGHCLPKDTLAFANYTGSQLVKKVVELNQYYSSIQEGR